MNLLCISTLSCDIFFIYSIKNRRIKIRTSDGIAIDITVKQCFLGWDAPTRTIVLGEDADMEGSSSL